MSRCTVEYEKFDKDFEELEIPPYTAAQEYYKAGWHKALEVLKLQLQSDGFCDMENLSELPKDVNDEDAIGYVYGYNNCKNTTIKYIENLEEK